MTDDDMALFAEPDRSSVFPDEVVSGAVICAGLPVLTFSRHGDELAQVVVLGFPAEADVLAAIRACEPDAVAIAETYGAGVELTREFAVLSRDCPTHGTKYVPEACEPCEAYKGGDWYLAARDVMPTRDGAFPVTTWKVPPA